MICPFLQYENMIYRNIYYIISRRVIIISTLTYKNTWENIVYINNNLFMFRLLLHIYIDCLSKSSDLNALTTEHYNVFAQAICKFQNMINSPREAPLVCD